jgi:hypothetical protein
MMKSVFSTATKQIDTTTEVLTFMKITRSITALERLEGV